MPRCEKTLKNIVPDRLEKWPQHFQYAHLQKFIYQRELFLCSWPQLADQISFW